MKMGYCETTTITSSETKEMEDIETRHMLYEYSVTMKSRQAYFLCLLFADYTRLKLQRICCLCRGHEGARKEQPLLTYYKKECTLAGNHLRNAVDKCTEGKGPEAKTNLCPRD